MSTELLKAKIAEKLKLLPETELQTVLSFVDFLAGRIIPKRSHSESKMRFQQRLKKYANRTFSDSVKLLQEDRAR